MHSGFAGVIADRGPIDRLDITDRPFSVPLAGQPKHGVWRMIGKTSSPLPALGGIGTNASDS